jgi:hypothetical protein
MEVEFKVRFMDWRKGDKATLKNDVADRYINVLGVCAKVKPPVKRKKSTAAPENKMVKGAANK